MKKILLPTLLGTAIWAQAAAAPIQNVDSLINEAITVTNEIQFPSRKAKALASIGVTMVRSGKLEEGRIIFNRAMQTAKESTLYPGAKIQSEVVFKIAESGLLDLAQSSALSMHPSRFRDGALTETIIRMAEKGEMESARALISSITAPAFRALAINGMAAALVQNINSHFQKRQEAYEELYKIPTDGK